MRIREEKSPPDRLMRSPQSISISAPVSHDLSDEQSQEPAHRHAGQVQDRIEIA